MTGNVKSSRGFSQEVPPLRRVLKRAAWGLIASLIFTAWTLAVEAQEPPAKRVLLISTGSRFGPGFIIVDQQVLQALATVQSPRLEIYAENLDVIRFPAERSAEIFGNYLAKKYDAHRPDLVILVYVGALGTIGKVVERAFPGKPIVVAGFTEEELRREQFGAAVSGVAQRIDAPAAFKLILRLHPDLRRIVVIGGTSEVDRQLLRRVEEAAQVYRERVEIEFWTDRSMADLRRAVTTLPPHTAVLYTRLFRDAAGQAYVSSEVGRWIGESANAPVYLTSDGSLGTGAVGGTMASIEAFGRRAGELARRILTGTPPESLPFDIQTDTVSMFDWRALKRWDISESRLPAGSVIRFKPPSLWEQYRWYLLAALAIILAQSATIVALAVQRRRAHRAQAALAESRQLTELASTAGGLGLWSREMDGSGFWANMHMRDLFGFGPHDELSFEQFFSRVHPDDRVRVLADAERATTAALPFEAEFRTDLPDGTQRWLLAKGRTLFGANGLAPHRMGVVLDITERRQAEQLLHQQRAFLRQVIDVNPNFIFAKDREGRFTLANQALADAYGVSVDDLIGRTDADFNSNPLEVAFFREMDLEVMDTLQERFIPEESVTDAGGNIRWLQTVKRPLVGSDGVANQVLGASTDITQRKKTEIELLEQRAALAHVARVAIMGELTASLAHELNQPLTAILGNASASRRLMDREPLDVAELRAALDDIVDAGHRAAEVIRRTRALIKKEEEREFVTLDLEQLVRDVVRLVRGDAVLHNVHISLELESDLPPVRGDRIQLQQVLLNIVLNAVDAMKLLAPDSRHLTVRTKRDEGSVRVAVSDCGPGIDADEIQRIFEPFYTTKRDGLGMGLPICRSIVESHGGRLWAENNPDGGATFYFTVPVQKTSVDA